MATKLVQQVLEDAVGNAEDNLVRAQIMFQSYTPKQMQQKYGESGQTCQQILDGYRTRYNELEAELKAVRDGD